MKEMTSRERVLCALNHQQPAWRPAGSEGRRNACRSGSHVHAVPVKEQRFGFVLRGGPPGREADQKSRTIGEAPCAETPICAGGFVRDGKSGPGPEEGVRWDAGSRGGWGAVLPARAPSADSRRAAPCVQVTRRL